MATPDPTAPHVAAFCEDIAPGIKPRLVLLRPDPGARIQECFANVHARVKRKGGRRVLGWHLWENPGVLIEAEFHAVWEAPNGTLWDVTPQRPEVQEARCLFIPLRKATFTGVSPDNIRRPLCDDPDVAKFLEVKAATVAVMTKYTDGKGQVSVPKTELLPLALEQERLLALLKERYPRAWSLDGNR